MVEFLETACFAEFNTAMLYLLANLGYAFKFLHLVTIIICNENISCIRTKKPVFNLSQFFFFLDYSQKNRLHSRGPGIVLLIWIRG